MRGFAPVALALAVAVAPFALGCPSSGTLTDVPQDSGADGDAAVVVPPTAACTGDPTACLTGSMSLDGFTATYQAAKVELYRVFPNGTVAPQASQILAKDGKYAFSGLLPWAHYYLRGVVRFGDPKTGASVASLRGRFAVPVAAGATFDLKVIPVQLEMLETVVDTTRTLQFVSAHVYDPASGRELTDATVTLLDAGAPTPMPYVAGAGGAKSYFVQFSPGKATTGPFQITTAHAAFGTAVPSWELATEAPLFATSTLTSPTEGSTVPAGQPLDVTWAAQAAADYSLVELFAKQGASFTSKYTSPASIASDVTKETIPASSLAPAGAYLLNVDVAQAACQLTMSKGCAYLVRPATANLTVQ